MAKSTKAPTRGEPLDVAGIAEYLGQTERWVYRAVAERRFRFFKTGGGIRSFSAWLDEYIEQNTYEPEA